MSILCVWFGLSVSVSVRVVSFVGLITHHFLWLEHMCLVFFFILTPFILFQFNSGCGFLCPHLLSSSGNSVVISFSSSDIFRHSLLRFSHFIQFFRHLSSFIISFRLFHSGYGEVCFCFFSFCFNFNHSIFGLSVPKLSIGVWSYFDLRVFRLASRENPPGMLGGLCVYLLCLVFLSVYGVVWCVSLSPPLLSLSRSQSTFSTLVPSCPFGEGPGVVELCSPHVICVPRWHGWPLILHLIHCDVP